MFSCICRLIRSKTHELGGGILFANKDDLEPRWRKEESKKHKARSLYLLSLFCPKLLLTFFMEALLPHLECMVENHSRNSHHHSSLCYFRRYF